jgi:hypothetical protein
VDDSQKGPVPKVAKEHIANLEQTVYIGSSSQ